MLIFFQVEDSIYGEHFPLAVRLHLAAWIEEKFSPSLPFNIDDPTHQKMAVGLAQQLLSQLEAKIAAMPNDPDKFLMRVKLQEQADILRVSPSRFYERWCSCLGLSCRSCSFLCQN